MKLIRGLHNIKPEHAGCVLTIGKFDGVHLGHQAVLESLKAASQRLSLPASVMVFEPHPEEFFMPDKAPARLMRWQDKYQKLEGLGVERLLVMKFNQHFAQMTAEQFIEQLLVEQLGVKFLVVGDDFRFGQQRKGDFAMLQKAGAKFGFEVIDTQSCRLDDCRVSSSAIRHAIADDDFALAEQMLGEAFTLSGKVIHGEKKGRTIGFPTANVALSRCKSPLQGVFAVEVALAGEQLHGVANIGNRPTVNGQVPLLEVHIFNYDKQVYGQKINVMPRCKIRDEMKFASFEALQQQIALDAEQAKQFFNR